MKMKRRLFVLLLAFSLILTGCTGGSSSGGRSSGGSSSDGSTQKDTASGDDKSESTQKDTASGDDKEEKNASSVNLLEVSFDGKDYDLSFSVKNIIKKAYKNDKKVMDPLYFKLIDENGSHSKTDAKEIQDLTENELICLSVRRPVSWDISEKLQVLVPKQGIQLAVYGFGGLKPDPQLSVFETAEGYGKTTTVKDVTGYYSIGKDGYFMARSDEVLLCFAIDGQPVSLDSYLSALPDTGDQELSQKIAILESYSQIAASAEKIQDFDLSNADEAVRVVCAAALASQDAIEKLNAGKIDNFAIIELGFTDGKLSNAAYFVYKKDSF